MNGKRGGGVGREQSRIQMIKHGKCKTVALLGWARAWEHPEENVHGVYKQPQKTPPKPHQVLWVGNFVFLKAGMGGKCSLLGRTHLP